MQLVQLMCAAITDRSRLLTIAFDFCSNLTCATSTANTNTLYINRFRVVSRHGNLVPRIQSGHLSELVVK